MFYFLVHKLNMLYVFPFRHKSITNKMSINTIINKNNIMSQQKNVNEAGPIQCSVCNKHFKDKRGLKTHAVVHTKERNHECSICCKTFGLKSNLQHHEAQVHRKEGLHYCGICKKKFANKEHECIRTKEKPFKCTECDQQFSLPWNLVRQKRSHSREMNVLFVGENLHTKQNEETLVISH